MFKIEYLKKKYVKFLKGRVHFILILHAVQTTII